MYGSYQRFLMESARMQVEARKTKPITRDQSEDRGPIKAIVFGKETPAGTCYGVKSPGGDILLPAEYPACDAAAFVARVEDGSAAAELFIRDYERAYPPEA